MIRISVPFHGSVPTNRTLSSTGPLSVQLKRRKKSPFRFLILFSSGPTAIVSKIVEPTGTGLETSVEKNIMECRLCQNSK